MRKIYNVNQIKDIIKSEELDESTRQIIIDLFDCSNNKEISLEELSELISDNTSVGCNVCLTQKSLLNGKCDWECEHGIFKWFATKLLGDEIVRCKDCDHHLKLDNGELYCRHSEKLYTISANYFCDDNYLKVTRS